MERPGDIINSGKPVCLVRAQFQLLCEKNQQQSNYLDQSQQEHTITQSEFDANTCNWRHAWENASYWLRKGCDLRLLTNH